MSAFVTRSCRRLPDILSSPCGFRPAIGRPRSAGKSKPRLPLLTKWVGFFVPPLSLVRPHQGHDCVDDMMLQCWPTVQQFGECRVSAGIKTDGDDPRPRGYLVSRWHGREDANRRAGQVRGRTGSRPTAAILLQLLPMSPQCGCHRSDEQTRRNFLCQKRLKRHGNVSSMPRIRQILRT